MHITENIRYIGVIDRKSDLFEGQYRIPDGISYNSYVILDEKVAVMDSVDAAFGDEWLAALADTLAGRVPDYLIVQHMEPDHSANVVRFLETYPDAVAVVNARSLAMLRAFFPHFSPEGRTLCVENGGTLCLGKHVLNFIFAPMVHWPEVMVTYDATDRVLFSADAFGRFGLPDATLPWVDEARRYYIGIVGKYGAQVQALLKAVSALDVEAICPLHGPVLSGDVGEYLHLYDVWSSYGVESEGVLIAYTSVYGNTREAVVRLAERLRGAGVPVVVHDLARTDMSVAVADAFRFGKVVLASTTYNGDVFPFMRDYLAHLAERNFSHRTVGLMENGSWAPQAAKVMRRSLEACRDIRWLETTVTIRSALSPTSASALDAMAEELCRA